MFKWYTKYYKDFIQNKEKFRKVFDINHKMRYSVTRIPLKFIAFKIQIFLTFFQPLIIRTIVMPKYLFNIYKLN